MDVPRTRDAPAGEDLSNGTRALTIGEVPRKQYGEGGDCGEECRVITCSHKWMYWPIARRPDSFFTDGVFD